MLVITVTANCDKIHLHTMIFHVLSSSAEQDCIYLGKKVHQMIEMVATYHRVWPCYIGGTPLYTFNHSFSLMNYVFLCAFTKKSGGLFSNYKLQQLIINGMLKNSKVRMQKTFPHVPFLTCPITFCYKWPDTTHRPSTHKDWLNNYLFVTQFFSQKNWRDKT